MNMDSTKIGIVIVVYYPDELVLKSKLARLKNSFEVVVVDNTPTSMRIVSDCSFAYIPLNKNTGIAKAQNEGIAFLQKKNCTHIVFFDQDSDWTSLYVESVVAEYIRISEFRTDLFLLGPRVINESDGEEYRSVVHKDVESDKGFVYKREIISSGSCLQVSKLEKTGLLDEAFFIDFVDFEYCWRAEMLGLVCGITNGVTLRHKVGQKDIKFPFGYSVIISSPFRYYYQYRNHLWLCKRRYVPLQWKVNTGIKHFLRILYFPFVVKGWVQIEKNIIKGIIHGIFK